MKPTAVLKHEAQIIAAVPRILGFQPVDSLVIVGLNGGPTGRVDAGPAGEIIESMSVMVPHLDGGAAVVGFGEGQALVDEVTWWLVEQGIRVAASIKADNGEGVGWSTGTLLDEKPALRSRDELVLAAQAVTDPLECEEQAFAAWRDGNGGLAWVLYDRAVALFGFESPDMADLRVKLETAVDPRAEQ